MNSTPFSLDTQFFPDDAQEDKIDLEIGKWSVFSIDPHEDSVHAFKGFMSSPPDGQEDMAWASEEAPALFGAFFCRPEMLGKDRNKLWIRKQAVIHPSDSRRHEPPLCGGYCLFYQKKRRLPVTGDIIHRAKLRLSLNLQRFIRHQPQQDDPRKPWAYRLLRRKDKRTSHGEEASLDGEDNWLPDTPDWKSFAAKEHFERYLKLIAEQTNSELSRACDFVTKLNKVTEDDWYELKWEQEDHYSLSSVETLWEFRSDTPIQDVWDIGAKLMQLTKSGGTVTPKEVADPVEAGRILNSPCFSIPIAEGVRLKVYAKTNKRIRFEIVHSDLRKRMTELLQEAGIPPKEGERPWNEVPLLLKTLREKAAKHMNQIMKQLRKEQAPTVKANSVVHLLAEVAAAAPPTIFKEKRLAMIQMLLIWLCYYKGFRGSLKKGPYSEALTTLENRGVIKYDASRRFYALSDVYKDAADTLVSATDDPLLTVFGANKNTFQLTKDGKNVRRIRE